ncbi:MAG: hypothetical protein ACXU68_09175 [Croceibacterium sp.]
MNTPTPVTRSGPGANKAIKPHLVDYGGTCLFDGMGPRVATGDRPDYLAGEDQALKCLNRLGDAAARACCGYGIPDLVRALDSEERRVVLIADQQELATDALYRVPLPQEFQTTKGKRFRSGFARSARSRPPGFTTPAPPAMSPERCLIHIWLAFFK